MITTLSRKIEHFLKLPPEPPAPYGDEQSLRVFRASPNYLKYQMIMWRLFQGFLFVAYLVAFSIVMTAAAHEGGVALGIAILAAIIVLLLLVCEALLSYLTLHLHYKMRWYKVTDRSLLIREGVWSVREMTMTFANIQNMAISQGPIQRWFGISDLKVESAGGGGGAGARPGGPRSQGTFDTHVGWFRGIDNAAHILQMMEERLRRSRSAGLGDTDDPEHHNPPAILDHRPDALVDVSRAILEEARALRQTCVRL